MQVSIRFHMTYDTIVREERLKNSGSLVSGLMRATEEFKAELEDRGCSLRPDLVLQPYAINSRGMTLKRLQQLSADKPQGNSALPVVTRAMLIKVCLTGGVTMAMQVDKRCCQVLIFF